MEVYADKKGWRVIEDGNERIVDYNYSITDEPELAKWFSEGNKAKPYEKTKEDYDKDIKNIFKRYILEITAIGIGKEEYANDKDYIQAQEKTYEFMYTQAKNGVFDEATNNAIIEANEAGKKKIAYLTLVTNNIRADLLNKTEDLDLMKILVPKLKGFSMLDVKDFSKDGVDSLITKLFSGT